MDAIELCICGVLSYLIEWHIIMEDRCADQWHSCHKLVTSPMDAWGAAADTIRACIHLVLRLPRSRDGAAAAGQK